MPGDEITRKNTVEQYLKAKTDLRISPDSVEGANIALCRCGGSTTKPFCDGTHSKLGFKAASNAATASAQRFCCAKTR